jgi:hypothetical protein
MVFWIRLQGRSRLYSLTGNRSATYETEENRSDDFSEESPALRSETRVDHHGSPIASTVTLGIVQHTETPVLRFALRFDKLAARLTSIASGLILPPKG